MRRSAVIAARNPEKRTHLELNKPLEGEIQISRIKKKFCPPKCISNGSAVNKTTKITATFLSKPTEISQKSSAYRIYFCSRSTKKHKTYLDGVLLRKGNTFTLFNEAGKQLVSKLLNGVCELGHGSEIECGSYAIEVDRVIDLAEYESGNVFIRPTEESSSSAPCRKTHISRKPQSAANKEHSNTQDSAVCKAICNSRNNPFAPNALVLYKPYNANAPNARFVTLCSFLSDRLRPHQREGVQFLYNCLTGVTTPNHFGAILADEMGLGKTLQCISIIWTLLKDGPTGPVISRAIIVVPSSLVDNWANEFKKWVGDYRLQVLAMQSSLNPKSQKEMIEDFVKALRWPVLIISYEMCRKFSKELNALSASKKGVLLVCDEGHRLKNAQGNRTISSLDDIGAQRKLIITGTPIQNQLEELYAMCSFVNPGLLSTLDSFRNSFIKPIVAWREAGPNCTSDIASIGQKRAEMLQKLTSSFILRRTSDILSRYLPPKTECVLFCAMSNLQLQLYSSYINSQVVRNVLDCSDVSAALTHITALRKLVNDPSLFVGSGNENDYPTGYDPGIIEVQYSCKLRLLESLLVVMHSQEPHMKTVIVSNFTQTLTIIEKLCALKQWKTLRLDGSTPAQTRQALVTKFNDYRSQETVFLLSAKAGGCGLNLIGASRLVLFDPDWNPAVDEQAMARIWRDGQSYPCIIYRLLTKGGIDEKIFQRQLSKQELSMVVEGKEDNAGCMNQEDLKRLFSLCADGEYCQTKTLLDSNAHPSWNLHCDPLQIEDPVLIRVLDLLPSGALSFAMSKSTIPSSPLQV